MGFRETLKINALYNVRIVKYSFESYAQWSKWPEMSDGMPLFGYWLGFLGKLKIARENNDSERNTVFFFARVRYRHGRKSESIKLKKRTRSPNVRPLIFA